jgi:hypothetical protein
MCSNSNNLWVVGASLRVGLLVVVVMPNMFVSRSARVVGVGATLAVRPGR